MIKNIFIREIQDNIFKLRFLLLGSVLILLFVFASLAFIADSSTKVASYESPHQLLKSELSNEYYPGGKLTLFIFAQRPITINRSPLPLWFFVNGNNNALPNYFLVDNQHNQQVKSEIRRKDENPWVKTFGSLDWIYIIGILGSFMAIALSYDAFTGEKEDGTLRLLLSNNIPRYKVLIGKFLGIFFTLFIPLVIGQLVCFIILNFSNIINLGMVDYQKIAGIVLLSWMYLTVFIFMGLFVSSLTHNSSSSLIILLFLWIVSTVIIPGSSSIIARIIYKLPRSEEVEKQAWNSYSDVLKTISGTNRSKYNETERANIHYESYRVMGERREEYRRKKFTQVDIARLFSRLSPMGTFSYGAEALAGVGLSRQKHLINQLMNYKNQLGEFILSEERRLSDDPKGILYFMSLPIKPFNTDAIPIFQEREITLREGLQTALLDLTLLFLFGIVFFSGSYVSFNRYDVR